MTQRKDTGIWTGPSPEWDESFTGFGDRLDFMSKEDAQMLTGRLSILPSNGQEEAKEG